MTRSTGNGHGGCFRRSTAPDPTTVSQAWDSYLRNVVIPSHAPPQKVEEIRNIFYTGAMVGFTLAMDLPDLPDAEALERLAAIEHEFKAHGEEMKKALAMEAHR